MLKRLNNVSIVYKLSGIISFPVIVSMLLVGVFTYTSNKRAIISRTYEQLTSVRFEKTQRVQNFVNNKILELEQLASTSSAVNVFECLNKDTSTLISIDVALFNQNIGNYLKMQAEVNRFIIVDEGKEYAININKYDKL